MISKNLIKYIQSLHSKKNREEEGLFIVEGVKLVTEFIQHEKFELTDIFATAEYMANHRQLLSGSSFKYTEVSSEELKKISLLTSPNQVLAIAKITATKLNTDFLKNTTTLFLDDIRDPGNLGTIIRIADWFGIVQVICSPNTTEVYNPKTLQASMGAILRVNVINMSFEQLLKHADNLPIYGALLQGANIYTTTLKHGVLVIGNEANGISTEVLKHITNPITIPSAGSNGSESLNAANACAIICSEFHRQLHFAS
jgi:TrmH family RNA methyltransferase